MATNTKKAPAATKAPTLAKAAPAPTKASTAMPATAPTTAPAAVAPAAAPHFTFKAYTAAVGQPGQPGYVPAHGWPAKSASGTSTRAYCAAIAQQLAAQHPNGFTLQQYAQALAAGASTPTGAQYKQPSNGWGAKLGNALTHANYFAGARCGYWLAPTNAPVPGSIPAK